MVSYLKNYESNKLLTNIGYIFIFLYAIFIAQIFLFGPIGLPLWHIVVDVFIVFFLIHHAIANKRFFCVDLVFYILFPFYFKISFILYTAFDINVFSLPASAIIESYLLCYVTWLFGIVLYFLRPKITSFSDVYTSYSFFMHGRFLNFNFFVPFLFSLAISLFFLYQVKDLIFVDVRQLSRLEVVNSVSQSGWFLKYFIIAYSWVLTLYLMRLKSGGVTFSIVVKVLILLIPVFIYLYTQQILGARREFVFIALFIMVCFVVEHKGIISSRLLFLGVGGVTFLIFVGGSRHAVDSNLVVLLTNSMGEFLFPISTFQYYNNMVDVELKAGVTYFYSFLNFIPKFIFPDKPLPLATDFALLVANPNQEFVMGYAITPITEAYANFGKLCVLFFPLILSLICLVIETGFKKTFLLFFVLLCQCLNFQRSDIASIFFETTMLCTAFYFVALLSEFKVKR
ncbi:O-antigen polymerase [Shewanella xiamenensis]|uniref:O-antigen polymerase n=1 Tax=Shewanella xiamenensis TaxID=332186 RepID=UPI00313C2004